MSSEPSILPRKWFAAAAALSLLLAGLAALLLFAPHPREPGIGLPSPATTLSLRQRGQDGLLIPWGTAVPGENVRIEVAGADPKSIKEIELFLSQDGAPPLKLKHDGAAADLKQLSVGRYRWNAVVHSSGDVSLPLEPPRGDPLAADFVVAPAALVAPLLQQHTLDGKQNIEIGGKTRAGANLGARFPEALPGAVLEIENKPAATAFDGSGARRVSVQKGDVSIDFPGPDGAYHWRARLVATAQSQSDWRAFGSGPGGDFVIFTAPTTQASKDDSGGGHDNGSDPANDNSGAGPDSGGPSGPGDRDQANKNKGTGKNSGKPGADPNQPDKKPDAKPDSTGDGKGTPNGRAFSSGMGSGYRGPLPSRVRPLPSLWHLALFRMGLIFGGIIAVLGILLVTVRIIKGTPRRPASVP